MFDWCVELVGWWSFIFIFDVLIINDFELDGG